MNSSASEYALALFEIAKEEQSEEQTASDVREIKKILSENKEYLEFLASPAIPIAERQNALKEAFGETNACFALCLLVRNGKTGEFFEFADEFAELVKDELNILDARIESAFELDEEEKSRIIGALNKKTGKKINAEFCINQNLIGGVKVIADGNVWDGSIQNRLKEVKDVIDK